ncbi:ABC1 domain containing protein [Ophiocordyceps camponoti-floridani]|uniref:Protein YAE1 n=1 Tax=Ophiocordyceps camponoti-floridani TaxID=2030778 RepID=A0A8H4VBT0_9HYPO|nr:ABC1 domain containing protein [Ophiocordyceps camponoti-floridani]
MAQETGSETEAASLDDVFCAEASHPSDVRRLQTEHAAAGYREAISTAKQTTIQAGFDDGFRLGAALGLRAGRILGLLEGICEAVPDEVEAEKLLATAREELSVSSLLSSSYWAPDGERKFQTGSDGDNFANSHPLIDKWNSLVDRQLARWAIDEAVLGGEPGRSLADEAIISSSAPLGPSQPLEW